MLVEAEKLRWLGVDMRARWRRRVAVVGTYAVFVAVVWLNTASMYGAMVLLVAFLVIGQGLTAVRKMYGLSAAWVMRALPWLVWAGVFAFVWFVARQVSVVLLHGLSGRPVGSGAWVGFYGLWVLCGYSALASGKLVDRGDGGWAAAAIRNPAKLSWRQRRWLARLGFAVGLEGFAWYEYGMRYKDLTPEQKDEIEAMSRANPRGKWMRQRDLILFDDERMRNEENRLRAQVQRVMTWVLAGAAVMASLVLMDGGEVHAETVVASLWTLAGLAMTLRQAIPLWTEPDPREMDGELAVVGGVEA